MSFFYSFLLWYSVQISSSHPEYIYTFSFRRYKLFFFNFSGNIYVLERDTIVSFQSWFEVASAGGRV